MPIRYTRVGWQDAPSTETPIDAANLNHMDNGILALSEEVDTELPLLRDQINDVSADIETQIDEKIPPEVSSWLTEHVTPAGSAVVVDDSLTIQGAAADAKKTGDELTSLKEDLNGKYDRYKVESVSGLSLGMFEICPSLYTITTHLDTDALTHGSLSGSGLTYLRSKFKSEYSDFRFKVGYVSNSAYLFALAVTDSFSIGFSLNLTSGNVNKYTDSANSSLTGIYRNSNCRNVTANDTLHFVKDGTKVALYLVDNNIDVPIFADEWVDILTAYANTGITSEDIGFGFITSNSARGNILVYDFTHEVESGDHFMNYDEVDGRLSALEDGAGFNPSKIDLFMFMGQSNMAGRGTGSQAPAITAQAGYEYRAISDPTKLYPITEPFGVDENVQDAIYDYLGGYKAKTGDLVPAFVNAYFAHTHVSIVGVSASEGGTRIALWQPDTARYTDALNRFTTAITWLEQNGYTIRHKYMLWCQGESNGDDGMSKADYISAFTTMANAWFTNGIEKIFLIKIGNYNGTGTQDYNTIMDAQNEICQTMQNVIMVSTDFAGMKDRGLMKDDFHYKQDAYNEVGTYAGINAALYVNTDKEPTMYDTQNGTLYFSHKN